MTQLFLVPTALYLTISKIYSFLHLSCFMLNYVRDFIHVQWLGTLGRRDVE